MEQRPLVSFDWAIKKLLRQKANYDILEGFLSELLKKEIRIINIPESEGNKEDENDKSNKVDILCENASKELILIELQYNSENDYFHRMLFGASKIITDYMQKNYTYDKVKKVFSINIVYFDLGQGQDYVYHGTTEFKGIHIQDILQVNAKQKSLFSISEAHEIYPEYYIIKVNKFNDIAKDSLDEWIYYLKNNKLPKHYHAKGLEKVSQILDYQNMDAKAKALYDAHNKEMAITYGVLETAKEEGRDEGLVEGRKEGLHEGEQKKKIQVVCNAFRQGIVLPTIATIIDSTEEEVKQILIEAGLMK